MRTARDRIKERARAHKLTPKKLRAIFDAQGGRCAVCRQSFGTWEERARRVCIDHDHACCPGSKRSCGQCVRGLVCSGCNRDLGAVDKSKAHVAAMLAYIAGESRPPSRATVHRHWSHEQATSAGRLAQLVRVAQRLGIAVLVLCLAGCAAPLERTISTASADTTDDAWQPAVLTAEQRAVNRPHPNRAVVADARLAMVQVGDWSDIDVAAYRATWAALVASDVLSGRLSEYGVHSIAIESWTERYGEDAFVLPDVAPLAGAPDSPGLVYVFLLAPGQTTTTMQAQGSRGYHAAIDGRPFVVSTYQVDAFVVPTHELSEALTDPVPGLGWTFAGGEVADVCQGAGYDVVAGVSVASVWSQELCGCL